MLRKLQVHVHFDDFLLSLHEAFDVHFRYLLEALLHFSSALYLEKDTLSFA